jgi:hypothetical protein
VYVSSPDMHQWSTMVRALHVPAHRRPTKDQGRIAGQLYALVTTVRRVGLEPTTRGLRVRLYRCLALLLPVIYCFPAVFCP